MAPLSQNASIKGDKPCFAVGITGLIQSAVTGIYAAALYRYVTGGQATQGSDAPRLAFAPKLRRRRLSRWHPGGERPVG